MNGLLKKFLSFGIGNIIVLFIGFLSTPIISRIVDPVDMGKFSMFNTISNLVVLIALIGLDQAFVRFFYEEDEDDRFNLLLKSLKIPMVLMVGIILFFMIFYKKISIFITGEVTFIIVVMLCLQCLFSVVSRFFILYIRMQQKAKLYSIIQVLGKVIYLLSIILILNFTKDYRLLIISLVISNILITIFSIVYQKKNIINKKKKMLKTNMRELLLYGSPLIITMSITWVMQSTDKLFIKEFSGYDELGLYASAFSIVALINSVQGAFTTFWVPVANEKYQNNPEDKEFFAKITSIITILMIVLATGIIVFKDVIIFLLGARYKSAMFIFPFLVFMPVMYTISETTVIGISFKKKTKYTIWIATTSAVVNVIGNIILVPKLGAKGAAISTGVSYIVFFLCRTIISSKLYKVNYELHKIMSLISLLSILALYASFNSFDLVITVLALVIIALTILVYRNIIFKYFKLIIKR